MDDYYKHANTIKDDQCEMWLLTREGRVISAWPTKVQAQMVNGMKSDGIIQGTFTTKENQ